MTIYQAIFLSVLLWVVYRLRYDERNLWAGLVITAQTMFAYVIFEVAENPVPPLIWLFLVPAVTFLIFSTRNTGKFLGILSVLISFVYAAGWSGWLSTETGLGIAATVWHWGTMLCYMQLFILWLMGTDRIYSRWNG